MKRTFIIFFLGIVSAGAHGQNLLDEQGRKTGHWRAEHPNGNTMYEATFIEGRPVGMMIRYYESGALQARMMFDSIDDRCYTELFHEQGKKAAEGWHVQKKKDSVWTYYSEFDGSVRIREEYLEGKLHGKVRSYYHAGGISEEMTWNEGSRDGQWLQYYENGALRLSGHYENDKLNGLYEVYHPDSILMMRGAYLDDMSQGTWSYYDETGALLYTLEYENGQPVDKEKYQQLMKDILLLGDSIAEPQPFLQQP
jgi:antitoxin component YwqK of YwqJK toxin-antitoxin module